MSSALCYILTLENKYSLNKQGVACMEHAVEGMDGLNEILFQWRILLFLLMTIVASVLP